MLAVTSGWTLSGSYQLSSGTPLMPRILGNVSNNSGTGSNASERPDATGMAVSLPRDERTTARYFNTVRVCHTGPRNLRKRSPLQHRGSGDEPVKPRVAQEFSPGRQRPAAGIPVAGLECV